MEQFGPFRLLRRIGVGGMCEVYLAQREGEALPVALKRLRPEMEKQPEAVDLFLNEADLGILLRHPNIVNTLSSDEAEGHYYIVMEFVDGPDLAKLLTRARHMQVPLDEPLAIHIALEMCHGLSYLHDACSPTGRRYGLVHRDVSPENVFVSRTGQVKMADIGIAKLNRLETVTTIEGGIKGKLGYMAPEQIRGEELDPRTDLFAAALILYELLTGQKPYARHAGETELSHVVRVRDADIPPASKLAPDLDPMLDGFLRKALQRKVKSRYDNMHDFIFELENYVIAKGIGRSSSDVAAFLVRLQGPVDAGG